MASFWFPFNTTNRRFPRGTWDRLCSGQLIPPGLPKGHATFASGFKDPGGVASQESNTQPSWVKPPRSRPNGTKKTTHFGESRELASNSANACRAQVEIRVMLSWCLPRILLRARSRAGRSRRRWKRRLTTCFARRSAACKSYSVAQWIPPFFRLSLGKGCNDFKPNQPKDAFLCPWPLSI